MISTGDLWVHLGDALCAVTCSALHQSTIHTPPSPRSIRVCTGAGEYCYDSMRAKGWEMQEAGEDTALIKFLGLACKCSMKGFSKFITDHNAEMEPLLIDGMAEASTAMSKTVSSLNIVDYFVQGATLLVEETAKEIRDSAALTEWIPALEKVEGEALRAVTRICSNSQIATILVGFKVASSDAAVSPCDYATFTDYYEVAESGFGIHGILKKEIQNIADTLKGKIRDWIDEHILRELRTLVNTLLVAMAAQIELIIEGLLGLIPEVGGLAGLAIFTTPVNLISTPIISETMSSILVDVVVGDTLMGIVSLFVDNVVETLFNVINWSEQTMVDAGNSVNDYANAKVREAFDKYPMIETFCKLSLPIVKLTFEYIIMPKIMSAIDSCNTGLDEAFDIVKCRLSYTGLHSFKKCYREEICTLPEVEQRPEPTTKVDPVMPPLDSITDVVDSLYLGQNAWGSLASIEAHTPIQEATLLLGGMQYAKVVSTDSDSTKHMSTGKIRLKASKKDEDCGDTVPCFDVPFTSYTEFDEDLEACQNEKFTVLTSTFKQSQFPEDKFPYYWKKAFESLHLEGKDLDFNLTTTRMCYDITDRESIHDYKLRAQQEYVRSPRHPVP